MKIVQINAICCGESTGRTTLELVEGLESAGHECRVYYSYGSNPNDYAIRIGSTVDRKLHAVLSRITGLQGYFSHLATARLIRQLRKYHPDVVHLRNLHANYINLRMLLRYLAKSDTATVLTLHDCWFFTGKCPYYVSAGCTRWQQQCGNCPLVFTDKENPTFFFDTTKKCLADKKKWFSAIPRLAVVGVSKWVTQEVRNGSILADRKLATIYNWIDFSIFQPRPSDLRKELGLENRFVILVVAFAFSKKKCLDEINAISAQMPENWAIVAIGKAPTPLPENVIHIPPVKDTARLAEYYSMADVCLNTTLYETFGKVTVESMCCGTPVVVYNNTASPELVEEGCGEIVEQKLGAAAIMDALKKVEATGKESYSAKCIEKAHARFSRDVGVSSYIELYQQLVAQKQAENREE